MIPGIGIGLGFGSSGRGAAKATLRQAIADAVGGIGNIISLGVASDATIATSGAPNTIAALPGIVGAELTPSSTGRATLQVVNGHPAAVFDGLAVEVCAYAMPKNAKTVIVVTRNDKPAINSRGLIHVNANTARLISTTASNWVALAGVTFYRDGAASAAIDQNVHSYAATHANSSASENTYLGSVPESGAAYNHKGPVWAWCNTSITASAGQVALVHTAFKEYFRSLLP